MNNQETILNNLRSDIENIDLTESYRQKRYKNNFNFHLEQILNLARDTNQEDNFILNNRQLKITKSLYWELEAYIIENTNGFEEAASEDIFDNREDQLRSKIVSSLGRFYDDSWEINELIDFSVNGFIMSSKYSAATIGRYTYNPWDHTKIILKENNVLHNFSSDVNYLREFGLESHDRDSDEIENLTLGIITKGKRRDYSGSLFRDIFGLRNYVLDLISEHAPNSGRPIKSDRIISLLRQVGIREIEVSDARIKSWFINPLKRMGKIGSSKEGYFLMSDCNDMLVTYNSHFENLKGYLRTLETYRFLANKRDCFQEYDNLKPFEKHLEEIRLLLSSSSNE